VPDDPTLLLIDTYLDAVPRSAVRTETVGPLTLFVQEGNGWRYYARPTPGARAFTPDHIEAVRARQRELGQPEAIEWVVELAPGLGPAAVAAGMAIHQMPLMYLPPGGVPSVTAADDVQIRFAGPEDDLAQLTAVAMIGFEHPGTEAADVGAAALADAAAAADDGIVEFTRERMRAGATVTAAAYVDGVPVSVGSHNPCGGTTEIVGVATLPAYRRRGIGAAVIAALIGDARDRAIETICLSAGSRDVARVYARAGFRQVGEVGAAQPSDG
jgi:GNAT superfamily N-acetyltransferase